MIAFVIEEMDGRTKFLTLDSIVHGEFSVYAIRWDEKAGLRRDAVRSQVIDAL